MTDASFARTSCTRPASRPCTLISDARLTVMHVSYASIAKPRLPKRLPRPPFMSRKPRCRRAGARTVTLSIITRERRMQACFARLALYTAQKSAAGNLKSRPEEPDMSERAKERTYTPAEIEARLKSELPHWHLEDGWIRRKYRTN